MNFLSYYGLEDNLFNKEIGSDICFKSNDFNNVLNRLNYLKEIKGIGLITGSPGLGKTYTLRCFVDSLNKDLYKVIYISPTNLGKFEFFGNIAKQLNINVGACYKDELFYNIQKEIKRLSKEQRVGVVILVDDAQNLNPKIIKDLKILFDFQMDSKDYTTIILCGHEDLRKELSKIDYEPIKQRIVINYKFQGLTREEVKDYIRTRLELSKQINSIFSNEALNGLYSASKGIIRRLNNLIVNCLMIGYQNKKEIIDDYIVMQAKSEIDFEEVDD